MLVTILQIVLLTVVWAALQGSFGIGNLLLGVALAAAVLRLARPVLQSEDDFQTHTSRRIPRPFLRTWRVLVLLLVFLRELTVSAVQVAWYTLQPTLQIRPGIVAYPLDVQTGREITALANLISLTPGTLSLDVSPDRSHLYVHSISVETPDGREVIREIKTSLEKHVSRALGPGHEQVSLSTPKPS